MKLFGFSRGRLDLHVEVEKLHVEVKCCGRFETSRRGEELWPIGTSRRGGETSRRCEVLWLVGLQVRCCALDELLIF